MMTPEQRAFEEACSNLHHLNVAPSIVKEMRKKGRDAIRTAQADQRRKDAEIAKAHGSVHIANTILAQEDE